MLRRHLISTLVVLGLVVTASPALAWEPRSGATFNKPKPWGTTAAEKFPIQMHVEEAIRQARPTAADPAPVILITSFLMDRPEAVDAIIGACRRGVSVRVVLDDAIDNRNSRRLVKALNSDNVEDQDGDGLPDTPALVGPCNQPLVDTPAARAASREPWGRPRLRESLEVPSADDVTWGADRSYVKQCKGSCRGGPGHMHSKFYVFSSTGTARHVIMVSSANLNKGGGANGWNDIYTMKGRPASYQSYLRIHREMTEDRNVAAGKVETVDGPFTSRFYPMRDAKRRNDPVLADLNRIGCRSAFGRTQIHVNMFGWRGTRGTYLADKLFSLKRQGCRLSIILGAPSLQMVKYLRQQARKHDVPLYNSRWDFTGDSRKEIRSHMKYVLVKGRYGRDRSSFQVMTGSANWVNGGLDRGDENTLNIASRSAYRQYLRNWNVIRRHSVRK